MADTQMCGKTIENDPRSVMPRTLTLKKTYSFLVCVVVLVVGMVHNFAFAQLTWTGTTNSTWDATTTNWSGGATWNAGSNAVFDASAAVGARQITVSGTQSIGNLIVSATGYRLSGGWLALTSPSSWTISQEATVSSGIEGADALTKSGSAMLTLSGSNAYSGTTTVSGSSILRVSNSHALGSTIAGTIISAGSVLELSGGVAIGSESFSIAGTGIGSAGAIRSVSGSNSIAGAIALTAMASIGADAGSTLAISGNLDAGTYVRTFVGSGTIFMNGIVSGNGTITKSGAGTLHLLGLNTYTGSQIQQFGQGTVVVNTLANTGSASSLGAGTANIRLGSGGNSATLTYTGTGHSTNRMVQIGSGSLSTQSGGATINANGSGAVAFTSGTFNLADSAASAPSRVLTLGGTSTGSISGAIIDNVANTSRIALTKADAGMWILSGASTYSGATTILGGRLVVGSTGSINSTSGITLNGATAELRYNSATALAKSLTFTQGTLSGTGTIASAVTANGLAATFSPGNSPGIMPFGTSQTWESFTYLWEMNDFLGTNPGTAFDQITITGSLALTGSAGSYLLDVTSLTSGNIAGDVSNFSDISRSWTILTTTGGISGFNPAHWTISTADFTSTPAATGSWSISNVGNDLVLNFVVVPEPATLTLAVMGATLAGMAARRRRSPAERR